MNYVASLLWGMILGTAAVMLHEVRPPFGLLLALMGSSTGIWILGRAFGKKIFKFLGIVGWIGVVLNAAAPGVGNELLVQGNLTGSALVLLGSLSLILAFFAKG